MDYENLDCFMRENVQREEEAELKLPGFSQPWVFRPVTADIEAQITDAATEYVTQNGAQLMRLNKAKYETALIVAATVFPNLNNTKLQESWGCMGADELLGKMLLAGSKADVLKLISRISGYTSMNEEVEAAKN